MIKHIYLLGCIIALLSFSASAQDVCVPSSKPTPQMGVHSDLVFSNCWNMINTSYGGFFGSANMADRKTGHACVYLGKDGWPKDNKVHSFLLTCNNSEFKSFKFSNGQVFKCKYKGTLSQLGNGTATQTFSDGVLQNVSESNGYVFFELRITNSTNGTIRFNIKNHIEDVQFMLPGYELDDPRMITNECKDYLRGAKVIRLMGQSGCNKTFERKWEHRTPANAPFENVVENGDENLINGRSCFEESASNPWLSNSFTQPRCYPWEKAIDVCNYLDVDFYMNVPVLIDLEYARELGKLLKQRLKPTLNAYLEIGNELWNFGGGGAFHGFAMEFAAVHQMVAVQGDKTIAGDISKGIEVETGGYGDGSYWTGGSNAFLATRRWPAYRLKQFMDEFAKSWGFADQGGVGVRIRAVLAGQLAYGWGGDYWFIGNEGVEFLKKQFGQDAASKYLYSLAITHYSNVPGDISSNASVDQIIKALYDEANHHQFARFGNEGDGRNAQGELAGSGNCEGNEYEDILAYAKKNRLKVMAYEGGPEVNKQGDGAWTPLVNQIAAYRSPKMYEFVKYTTNKWYEWMGYDAIFIKNSFSIGYGAGYGVSEAMGEISPQYKAYREIMDNPAPALTKERGGIIGVDPITSLPGWKTASYRCQEYRDATQNNKTRRRLDGTKQSSDDVYIIRNETSGLYQLRLLTSFAQENVSYDIYLNGILIKSGITRPFDFSGRETYSDPIQIKIPYGTHVLQFTKTKFPEAQSSGVDLASMEFKLLNEEPPAKPEYIYGDLQVCNGNTKAKYEVSPIDFSVCDYEWVGLPTTAKILPNDSKPPASGQGSYLMYVDWGNTANGTYDLKVRGKNQSKIGPGYKWLEGDYREFKVKVQTCGFTVNPTPVCLNSKVTFTPDGLPPNIISYRWDSGDPDVGNARFTTKTDASPYEYTYKKVGVYDINLTVTVQSNKPDGPKTTIPFFNKVNVTSCNAPTVVTPLTYCQGQTGVPAVTATAVNGGTNLKWYTQAKDGTALANAPTPTTLAAATTSYYVSQMNGTKESDRTKLEVIVSNAPSAPVVSAPGSITYCKDALGKVADLTSKVTSTATLKWYKSDATGAVSTTAPAVPVTTTEGSTPIWVSQSIGQCESPKSQINIVVTPPLAAPTVTGTVAPKCVGTSVAASELTSLVAPATGKTIQWHASETSAGTATPPTVSTTTIGTKSVWVSQKEGDCQSAKVKIDIEVTDGPAKFIVGGGGVTDCKTNLGQAVTLSGSTAGINYVLTLGSLPKDTLVGTGSALSFAPQTEAGNYIVLASSAEGCKSTMTGSAKLTNPIAPKQQTFTGGGIIDCTGPGRTLTLGTTEADVKYYLILNGKDTAANLTGNGSKLDFAALKTSGQYSVRASKGGCETSMTDGAELISATPVKVFALSSTGKLDCSGAGSITIALPSSEAGVEYTLYKDNVATTSKQTPTTAQPINFVNIKLGGTYTIKALNPTTKCEADMTGNKLVEVPQIPIIQTLTGGGRYCEGETAPVFKLQNSELNVTYTLKTGSGTSQVLKDTKQGTGAGFDFALQDETQTYTVTASKGIGVAACTKEMSGSIRLDKLPPSVGGIAAAAQAQVAKGGNTVISISGQTGDITWQSSTDGNSFVDIVPAQSSSSFNTGVLATEGDYYYRAKLQSGTCPAAFSLAAKVKVIYISNAGFASVVEGKICKGSSANLTLASSTGIIQWQDSIAGGVFKNITSANSANQATPALTQTTWFRAKVGADVSNTVEVAVVAPPIIGTMTGPANATAACEDNGAGYSLTISPIDNTANYDLYKDGIVQNNAILNNGAYTALKQAGNYTVKANLIQLPTCTSDMSGSFSIAAPKLPTQFKVSGGGSACGGTLGGIADIKLENSELGVSYALSDGISVISGTGLPLIFPKTITAANAGSYFIMALNTISQCGEQMDGRAEISIKAGVGTPILSGETSYCNQTPIQIGIQVDNAAAQAWRLTPATAGTVDNTGNVNWSKTYEGTATIKVEVSNIACGPETKEAILATTVTATPIVSPIIGDSMVCRGNIVTYQVVPQTGVTYNWSINTSATIEKDDSKGMITVTYMEDLPKEGTIITVTPESVNCGIGTSKTKAIKKDDGCDLYVPNILTTNTGDKNSVWQLEGVDNYPKMSIEIFNRWGAKVHSHSGKYDKPWDGTTSGKPLPTATYYYVIDKNDGSSKITGSVTVVRE